MALNREVLFVALLARLQTQLADTVQSFTRRWTSWDDSPPAQQPALMLLKGSERSDRQGRGLPIMWHLRADIWVYVRDDGTGAAIPSTQINEILTTIEAALEVQPDELTAAGAGYLARRDQPPAATTLGGLCYSCQIVDEVEVDEGTQGHVGVLRVPVEIVAAA